MLWSAGDLIKYGALFANGSNRTATPEDFPEEEAIRLARKAAAQAAGATTLNFGLFLNSVVSFFITMFAIFLFVRTMNKMRDKKPVNTHACPYCKSTINNAATKCPFCCSDVEAVETGAVVESDLKKGVKEVAKIATNVADGALDKIKKIKKITKR